MNKSDRSYSISVRDYAERRGVTVAAIMGAINRGKLTEKSAKKIGKHWHIDPEAADLELSQTQQPHNGGDRRSQKAREARAKAEGIPAGNPKQKTANAENSEDEGDEDEEISGGMSETFMQAKTRREITNANMAALELAEKEGLLVPKADVDREAFRVARTVRDSLLNIPDRTAAELAAETNQFRVHERLKNEIRRALEGLKLDD